MTFFLPLLLISLPSQEATDKEHVIIQRQNQEEEVRRQQAEQRMNRWYNRLLGRHQDDPVSTGQSLITLGQTHKATHFVSPSWCLLAGGGIAHHGQTLDRPWQA